MRTIWKFRMPITDLQEIHMPEGAEPIFVANQNGWLCLWVIADPEATAVPIRIAIRGTGHPVEENLRYIGSAVIDPFVWHVFRVGDR